jgi:hypothetical protein
MRYVLGVLVAMREDEILRRDDADLLARSSVLVSVRPPSSLLSLLLRGKENQLPAPFNNHTSSRCQLQNASLLHTASSLQRSTTKPLYPATYHYCSQLFTLAVSFPYLRLPNVLIPVKLLCPILSVIMLYKEEFIKGTL